MSILFQDGFDDGEWTHSCVRKIGENLEEIEIGNIFAPAGWQFWFCHDPGKWDQPEGHHAWLQADPNRVHAGDGAYMYFGFFRKIWAGLMRRVTVVPGTTLTLAAWVHAWSNSKDGPHPDDGRWSEGSGHDAGFCWADEPVPGGSEDDWRNFTFNVGIDPAGGEDPFAPTVVWGRAAHVYNQYRELTVTADVTGQSATVFLSAKTKWPFKHNDAYWDDVELRDSEPTQSPGSALVITGTGQAWKGESTSLVATSMKPLTNVKLTVEAPDGAVVPRSAVRVQRAGEFYVWGWETVGPFEQSGEHIATVTADGTNPAVHTFDVITRPGRGAPRIQYARTYVLLPQGSGPEWAKAVIGATWPGTGLTVGQSADDAGIGDLDVRRVVAVNPDKWPGDLRAFFDAHYPGVEYHALVADSPSELVLVLSDAGEV